MHLDPDTIATSRSPLLKEQLDVMGQHIEETVTMELWRKNDIHKEILSLKEKLKKEEVTLANKRLKQVSFTYRPGGPTSRR